MNKNSFLNKNLNILKAKSEYFLELERKKNENKMKVDSIKTNDVYDFIMKKEE